MKEYLTIALGSVSMRDAFKDFLPFFKAMVKEMDRHAPEKGDTWKTMSLVELEDYYGDALEELELDSDNTENQLVDLANFEAMIWTRYKVINK